MHSAHLNIRICFGERAFLKLLPASDLLSFPAADAAASPSQGPLILISQPQNHTAFFTFLRANLVLPASAMSSNVSTPLLEPSVSYTLLSPSPSPLATNEPMNSSISASEAAPDLGDDIPPLSLDVLTKHDDKVEALRLVADSIAQQRQQAALALVFHPLCLAGLVAGVTAAWQFAWVARHHDLGLALTLVSGMVMTYLLAIRYLASGYIRLAEELKWDWLVAGSGDEGGGGGGGGGGLIPGEEDTVIGTRFGGDLIGALVLRLEPRWPLSSAAPTAGRRRGGRNSNNHPSLKGGKGVIRAWTTTLRYRGQGIGADMLHEAVRVTRERCGRDAEVGFAREHANSARLLPDVFNRGFRRSEVRAAKALEGVLAQWEGSRRKR